MRIIREGMALLRGLFLKIKISVVNKNSYCGNCVRVMKGTDIRVRKDSSLYIGNHAKVGKDVCISALNGGSITIGDNVGIGDNSRIISHGKISIDNGTIIAPNVHVYDHDHSYANGLIERKKYNVSEITIGKNAWIGVNNVILRGSIIGDGCIIGAGCVVKGTVKDNSIFVQKRENIIKEINIQSN